MRKWITTPQWFKRMSSRVKTEWKESEKLSQVYEDRLKSLPQNRNFQALLFAIYEAFIEPLLFPFAIFLLFERMLSLITYSQTYPEYSIWELLNMDMYIHEVWYIALFVIFILWALGKAWKNHQDDKRDKAILSALKNINDKLDKLTSDTDKGGDKNGM